MRLSSICVVILIALLARAALAQTKRPSEPLETGFERKLGVVYKTVGERKLEFDLYGPCDFENQDLFNHDDRPGFRDRFGPRIVGKQEVTAEEKLRLYREMSPITYLKRDSPPLLMIQGDKDTTIFVKHAYHMEKRARELQAPVQTLIVKNAGHNWREVDADIEPSRDEIIRATVEFFVGHAK